MSARRALWRAMDPAAHPRGLSKTNLFLTFVILASATAAVVETEPLVAHGRDALFDGLEVVFALIFTLELLARLWIAPESAPELPAWRARLKWLVSPAALLDMLALLPALVWTGLTPAYLLRLFRLARILRLAKLGRMSRAWRLIATAVSSRRHELLLTLFAGFVLLVVSATLMYLVEGASQPDKFGSIPRALWWATITLTTIGYGDVYPETTIGKMIAGITAILGIGLIAAPTGILAAAFSDAIQRHKEELAHVTEIEIEVAVTSEAQASSR